MNLIDQIDLILEEEEVKKIISFIKNMKKEGKKDLEIKKQLKKKFRITDTEVARAMELVKS